jgi:CRP/FNR family transcriptional regulator, anaerobic regulatory protein
MTNKQNRSLCTQPEWVGRADCKHCAIRYMMLFSDIDIENFDHILEPITNLGFASKAKVYGIGDEGKAIYSIRKGLIKLEQYLPDGTTRIVRLLGPGSIMGLETQVSNTYQHTAIALQELDVCRIPVASLVQLERENPVLSQHVMEHWERHLNLADQWIIKLSSGIIRKRVINFLLMIWDYCGNGRDTLKLLNYDDIAAITGTSRETVTRTIAELKASDVIQKGDSSKEIRCDIEKLQELVDEP